MSRYYFILNIFLLFVGLVISTYLFFVYTSNSVLPCSITHGCDTVRYSPYAKIYGIPVPFFGMLFYCLTLLFSGLVLIRKRMRYLVIVWLLTAWGFIFAGYLTYLEAFVIHAWCIWCVINAIVNVMTFVLSSYVVFATAKVRSAVSLLSP